MRADFATIGSGLTYEIRNIVEIANFMKSKGLEISWENIGDPVMKGEQVPEWIKDVLKEVIDDNLSFAYSPTKGVDSTREYLAAKRNALGGAQITKDDIIFFNGLGDAIARSYSVIRVDARIIMPEPTYSTHFMAEVAHASFPPNTYKMNPYNNWAPDLGELERKIKSAHSIVGILIINPDNPTGYVYTREKLEEVVRIAREHNLFIVADEIYHNMIYNGQKTPYLSEVIGDVPAISMNSLSKEVPWPGARCAWIEVYNYGKDADFDRYIQAIFKQKQAEVCSTTMPQMAIPKLMEHPEYAKYLQTRVTHYEKLADIAYNILKDVPYIVVNRSNGAFYLSVVFNEAVFNNRQHLEIENKEVKEYVNKLLDNNAEHDKRFAYNLLGATGICLVPLTSFFTNLLGFRITLLEKDVEKFEKNIKTIAQKIVEYVESTK